MYEALGNLNNPFKKWIEGISDEGKSFLQTGNNINSLYFPELLPYIIKCMKEVHGRLSWYPFLVKEMK